MHELSTSDLASIIGGIDPDSCKRHIVANTLDSLSRADKATCQAQLDRDVAAVLRGLLKK